MQAIKPMGKYIIKTYPSAHHSGGFVANIEWWSPWPGTKSKHGDIKFGFKSLRDARNWANGRLKQLRRDDYASN